MISLQGQTAIVTGASSGIGAGIAQALAKAGAKVAVNYRSSESEAEHVVENIKAAQGQALAVKADVSREDQVAYLFSTVKEEFGGVDVMVCNAGVQKDAAFVEMTLQEWRFVLDINLTGAFLCAREAAREFLRRGVNPEHSLCAGKIIFTSSVHEKIPWAGHANYASSKGGVMMLMKTIAQELAPHKIRVNSIAPGAIKTEINRQAWEAPEAAANLRRLIPYGRIGEPEDIAAVAVWLASDASDYITGTTIFVDGGMLLYPGFSTGG
ncbi:MAG: SDR family oxidoreductase [Thermodesulfobacteriota bacterium]